MGNILEDNEKIEMVVEVIRNDTTILKWTENEDLLYNRDINNQRSKNFTLKYEDLQLPWPNVFVSVRSLKKKKTFLMNMGQLIVMKKKIDIADQKNLLFDDLGDSF
jgi:hypothetical protein